MRILVLTATLGALALPAGAAQAQYYRSYDYGYYDRGDYRDYQRDVRRAQRECRRDLRRADSRREYRRELRDCRPVLRQAQREFRRDVRDDRRYYDYGYNRYNNRRYWDGYRWRYSW